MQKLARVEADAQPKYRTYAAFLQGVGAVNEPDLSDKERLALNCLAVHGDFRTGGGAHPGNLTLSRWCNVSRDTSVRRILSRLVGRRLTERTSAGHGGRGLATVWRIRIEDPRFPEPKPAPDKERVSQQQNQLPENQNPLFGAQKPAPLRERTSFTSNGDSSDSRLRTGEMPLKVVEVRCESVAGRRRHRANPKPDDDENPAHTPETLPLRQDQKLSPQFRAWMRQRILARAGRKVENEHAYVRTCEPEFLENLAAEVEEYLQQLAVREFQIAIAAAPRDANGNFTVPWTPIAQFLEREAQKYGLAVEFDAIRRACKYANDVCGLKENPA